MSRNRTVRSGYVREIIKASEKAADIAHVIWKETGVKIDNSLKGVTSVRTRETRGGKEKPAAATNAPPLSTDSVELTQTSARLSALEEALAQVPPENAGKVESIRQAIAEGRFQVDEEAVADALVQGTMEQLRRQGSK